MTLAPYDAPYDAVVFDLDGTLVDTETLYRQAFMEAAASLGFVMAADRYAGLIGIASRERAPLLLAAFGAGFPLEAFFTAYRARRAMLLGAGVPVRAGAASLLRRLAVPKAVATSASRPTASAHLRRTGLAGHFMHVVTRDDVTRGKPAPDVFLLAARRLGVAPARCIAVEDSPPGAAAARAAGMRVVLVGAEGCRDLLAVAGLLLPGTHGNVHSLTAM